MILAFDPSSTAIGFAALRSCSQLEHAGVIRPDRVRDEPLKRIAQMVQEAKVLVVELKPERVVIEMPQAHAKKTGGSTGVSLAMYGMACGAVWWMCWEFEGLVVHTVGSGQWSRVSKELRQVAVASQFPAYRNFRDTVGDKGGDASDAIALGQWWLAMNATTSLKGSRDG